MLGSRVFTHRRIDHRTKVVKTFSIKKRNIRCSNERSASQHSKRKLIWSFGFCVDDTRFFDDADDVQALRAEQID